jgi:hypothetical protein
LKRARFQSSKSMPLTPHAFLVCTAAFVRTQSLPFGYTSAMGLMS